MADLSVKDAYIKEGGTGLDNMIDLNQFAEGAMAAKVNHELEKVLDNIADPNTDPTKNRKITIEILVHGDENRDVLNSTIKTKVKLEPMKDVSTKLVMGTNQDGTITGKELRSGAKGQMFLDNDGDIAEDNGEKVQKTDDPNRVINFREKG